MLATARSRSKHAVTGVTAVVFDVERKDPELSEADIEALADRLLQSKLEFVLTSSYSCRLPDKCRFRLVIFVDRPILPTEFVEARKRLRTQLQLDGIVDTAAEDVSRIFFWPSCPPGVEPFAIHQVGEPINVDELLVGYRAVQFEAGRFAPPTDWQYVRPVDPAYPLDLGPLHACMDKYKAAGERDPQVKQSKVNLMRLIRKGMRLTSTNYDDCLWRAVNLLAWNLPAGTSCLEIRALMESSMIAMYGDSRGPISLSEAYDILQAKIERVVEARAAEEAGAQAVQAALFDRPAALEAKLETIAAQPPATVQDLRAIDAEILKECEFVYSVPAESFYYRADGGGFETANPVGAEGITAHLRTVGWDAKEIALTLKAGAYTTVYGLEFEPKQPTLFRRGSKLYINSWRPPALVPAPGEWPSISRILDSLTYNDVELEDGSVSSVQDVAAKEHLINWLAWCVQHPGGVPGTAVLVNGAPQGSGKNILAHIMFEIFGPDNCAKITTKSLEGRFTSRWIGKCFVFGDEIFARGQAPGTVGDITDTLKDLITGQLVISEGKGVNETVVRNRAKFLFASNAAFPIRLEEADRRFNVFTRHASVSEEYRRFTAGLFTPDNNSTEAFKAEIGAFAYYLERYAVDLERVKRPYDNFSRRALIQAAAPSHEAFCEHVDEYGIDGLLAEMARAEQGPLANARKLLNEMFPTGWDFGVKGISTQALHRAYLFYCKRSGIEKPYGINKFGALVRQHQPAWASHRFLSPNGARVWGYSVKRALEDLELRPAGALRAVASVDARAEDLTNAS